jgi:hypothetical protein
MFREWPTATNGWLEMKYRYNKLFKQKRNAFSDYPDNSTQTLGLKTSCFLTSGSSDTNGSSFRQRVVSQDSPRLKQVWSGRDLGKVD